LIFNLAPFAQSASVSATGFSQRRQRTLTDMGADLPTGREVALPSENGNSDWTIISTDSQA
jgi:hypothetical protein